MKVSVIIPVYNTEQGIKKTLNALVNQRDIKTNEYEVLVVDNNSTDDTRKVISSYTSKYPELISMYLESKQGAYAARNKGIEYAQGEILCFIDADMEPEDLYLCKILHEFTKSEVHYAGVKVELQQRYGGVISDYDAILEFRVEHNITEGHFVPTCCLTLRKDLLDQIGKFDERLESGGDLEFGKRAFDAGYEQKYFSHITITHPARETYKSLSDKFKRIGRGYAQLCFYYPHRFKMIKQDLKTLTFYLPNNPFTLYKDAQKRELGFSFVYCFLLAFILVPLRVEQLLEYNSERRNISLDH